MNMAAIRRIAAICLVALVSAWLSSEVSLWACPGCKEAVAAQDIEADSDVYNPSQLARAYNYSIYLMLSMPYLLTAFFGAACYVMLRRQTRTGPGSDGPALLDTVGLDEAQGTSSTCQEKLS